MSILGSGDTEPSILLVLSLRLKGSRVRSATPGPDIIGKASASDGDATKHKMDHVRPDMRRHELEYLRIVLDIRTRHDLLRTSGDEIPHSFAHSLVAESAWWLTHPRGTPVHAPGHAKRLENLYCGWSVRFGANWFAAGRALARARNYANSVLDRAGHSTPPTRDEMYRYMRGIPSGCVLNVNLNFYDYYPTNSAGELVFGAQAIDVDCCARELMH